MSYYDLSPAEQRLVNIGRELMTLAEEHIIYRDNDELWNAAISAGSKLTTVGSIFSRFNGIDDLDTVEKKVLREFLNSRK
jgi:hypothetical protein